MGRVGIPKQFTMMGRTFKVRMHDKPIPDDDDPRGPGLLGRCDHDQGVIHVCKQQAKDSQVHTFYHEITHAILGALGRETLNRDERFVDQFSGLLLQVLKTSSGHV